MFPQSTPNFDYPPNSLDWAERQLGEKIVSSDQLKGSTSAVLYDLTTGSGQNAILRLFTLKEWLENEPDLARHEAHVLNRVKGLRAPSPNCIAFDEFGAETTHPAVLMSKLDGVVDIGLDRPANYFNQLATTLHEIHQAPADNFGWHYRPWFDIDKLVVPSWSKVPDAFARMIDMLKQPPPEYKPVFLHRDYHPTNVLWRDGEVSGVVDWVNGCIGPAMIDVAHCRNNLACLYGLQAADDFLQAWISCSGAESYSVWWDICGLANGDLFKHGQGVYGGWADFGRHDITIESIAKNLDDLAVSICEKLKGARGSEPTHFFGAKLQPTPSTPTANVKPDLEN